MGGLAIVIMGVTGSGKSTIGTLLAKSLDCNFIDADDFHSAENKEKMHNGTPLTDEDRIPWLEAVRDAMIDYIIKEKQNLSHSQAMEEDSLQNPCSQEKLYLCAFKPQQN